jgi:hypothetical protein
MKRIATFIFLATALMLASCNIKIDVPDEDVQKSEPTAVGFGVYMNRGVTTKAGYAGELTTDVLKRDTVGFGVFSFYGNGAMYNETMKPDFMYNQLVKFTSNNVWEYSPIKYWPNEFGEAAGNEIADRLSFFAYAPYVAVTPSTGIVTGDDDEDGILGMTRNISAGDPQVMYGARLQPGGGVDLCWGVAANNFTSSVDGNNNKIDKGKPYINLIKPKTGDKIAFEFNHALTQLNVQIDADIDVESHATSSLDARTRVYVRSVTFTGFALRGSLNLNSDAGNPAWSDISGTGRLRRDPVTIYDGRSDGLEGVESAVDVNETPAVLSPIIIQSKKFGQETTTESIGVTNETVNLFANYDTTSDHSQPVANPDAPVMVIPIAGVPLTVTIVYDIETKDPNLAGYLSDGETRGISIENKITKSIQLSTGGNMTLEAGKKYVIGLHLGLTSVKFDAQVADWDSNTYEGTAYLPTNTTHLYIHDEASWNAAFNNATSALRRYYDWADEANKPYKEDMLYVNPADPMDYRAANGNDMGGTDATGHGLYPNCTRCWLGAILAPGARYPWVVLDLPIPFVGKIEFVYDDGTGNPIKVYPWGDQIQTFSRGFGVASIPTEFNRADWDVDANGHSTAQGDAAFDWSKLKINLLN